MVRFTTADEMIIATRTARNQGFRVGLVSAAGYLRPEHLDLIRQARAENDRVIVGITMPEISPGCTVHVHADPDVAAQDMVIAQKGGADWVFVPERCEKDHPDGLSWITSVCLPDRVYSLRSPV